MTQYLPSIKRYSWIVVACVLVAAVAGLLIMRAMPPAYLASSTVVVQAPSAGAGAAALASDPTHDIAEANDYAAEIPTRGPMTLVSKLYPELAQHGFSTFDLMHDVTATPSTSAATITIEASASTPRDAVMIANDVASGFVAYVAQQKQAQLDAVRSGLQQQLDAYLKTKNQLEQKLLKTHATTTTTTTGGTNSSTSTNGSNSSVPGSGTSSTVGSASTSTNTTTTTSSDPSVAVYSADLASLNQTITSLEAQIAVLPTAATSDASAIQLATLADVSQSAKPILIAAATLASGLILGILLAGLMIYLDRRLLGEDQVKVKLALPYLGGISSDTTLGAVPASAVANAAQESANIVAGLRLMGLPVAAGHDRPASVLLVTSARAAEGKTTLACALAGSLVRSGSSVAIVDANLHQPATHLSLGINPSGAGLGGLLTSEGPMEEALLQVGDTPGLWLLPGGSAIDSPTLLLQERLPEILAQIGQKVDVVIIDGPALLTSADAILLANMADYVTLVVDARHDQLRLLERAIELLTSLSSTPVSIILNRLPSKRRNRYFASAPARRTRVAPRLAALPTPEQLVPVQVAANGASTNGNDSDVSSGIVNAR